MNQEHVDDILVAQQYAVSTEWDCEIDAVNKVGGTALFSTVPPLETDTSDADSVTIKTKTSEQTRGTKSGVAGPAPLIVEVDDLRNSGIDVDLQSVERVLEYNSASEFLLGLGNVISCVDGMMTVGYISQGMSASCGSHGNGLAHKRGPSCDIGSVVVDGLMPTGRAPNIGFVVDIFGSPEAPFHVVMITNPDYVGLLCSDPSNQGLASCMPCTVSSHCRLLEYDLSTGLVFSRDNQPLAIKGVTFKAIEGQDRFTEEDESMLSDCSE